MFSFLVRKSAPKSLECSAPIFFTNTQSGKREAFAPLHKGEVSFYACGPTVYGKAHIGNMRTHIMADSIARVLAQSGLHIHRITNITDVGHLVADQETGEDKMTVGAKREGTTPAEIAKRYTDMFVEDLELLGVNTRSIRFPKATEYIEEQIELIKILEKKGYTYQISDGVYFDTAQFANYGKLGGHAPEAVIKQGSAASLKKRIHLAAVSRIGENTEKKSPADFALWRKAKRGDLQQWNSPWGFGNPGWHIECSAMIKSLLGTEIDIHAGGEDLVAIHHNNEIAQSESANERPLARYWIHGAFLSIQGDPISKSLGNDIYVSDVVERGFHPLALRYLFLTAHYRSPLSFSWESLEASHDALHRLWKACEEVKHEAKGVASGSDASKRALTLVREDLSTPQAIAFLWSVLKDDTISAKDALGVITVLDDVLGLSLLFPPVRFLPLGDHEIPEEVKILIKNREDARKSKNFVEADRFRIHIEERGYRVEDSASGPLVHKR